MSTLSKLNPFEQLMSKLKSRSSATKPSTTPTPKAAPRVRAEAAPAVSPFAHLLEMTPQARRGYQEYIENEAKKRAEKKGRTATADAILKAARKAVIAN